MEKEGNLTRRDVTDPSTKRHTGVGRKLERGEVRVKSNQTNRSSKRTLMKNEEDSETNSRRGSDFLIFTAT